MTTAELEAERDTLLALLRGALAVFGKLPLWTPEERESAKLGNYDPLYGPPPKYYPAAVLVDSEKLVAGREVHERITAALPKESDAQILRDAVAFAETIGPLPRCKHGKALRDGAGEALEPSCGCRAALPKEQL